MIRLRRAVERCVRNRRRTAAGLLLLVSLGSLCYASLMPREGYPNVELPLVAIEGEYPGASQHQIDDEVVRPLLAEFADLEAVTRVGSLVDRERFSLFVETTDAVDPEQTYRSVESIAENARDLKRLPSGITIGYRIVEGSRYLGRYDALVAVYGPDGASTAEIDAVARNVIPLLAPLESVARVELTSQNPSRYGRYALIGETENELRPSSAIGVATSGGSDLLTLRSDLDNTLASSQVAEQLPSGYGVAVALDHSERITRQIGALQLNIAVGLVLVSLIALVLISWQAALITAIFVPSVIAISSGLLYLLGQSLNSISLFGMILALGLFVDDAIVLVDALDASAEEGKTSSSSINRAIERVGGATISGTLTTVLVFAPMLAITGILGAFIRILPVAVIIALLTSLCLSLVAVPLLASVLPPRRRATPRVGRALVALGELLAGPVQDRSSRGLARGVASVGLGVALSLTGYFYFAPKAGFNVFPKESDSNEIAAEFHFAHDTSQQRASQVIDEVSEVAIALMADEVVGGFTYDGTAISANSHLRLTEVGQRRTAPDLAKDLLGAQGLLVEDAIIAFSQVSEGPPEAIFPFRVQVFHEELDIATKAASEIEQYLEATTFTRPNGTTFTVRQYQTVYDQMIARFGDRRYVEIFVRFDADDTSTLLASTRSAIRRDFPPQRLQELGLDADGLGFDFGMESRKEESFASVPRAFAIALFAMLILLIVQFRSLSQWVLVLSAVPLGFFGAFGGLWLSGLELSFFVMLGILGLVGIAVNNTILLTDFANQERRQGSDSRTAAANAMRSRSRPLLATMLTTVAGVLPLALTEPLWESLGLTIIFGLLSSTLLVLLTFPHLYVGLEAVRDRVVTPWRPGRQRHHLEQHIDLVPVTEVVPVSEPVVGV